MPTLRLGDIAPNFNAQTSIGDINFYQYLGNSWGVLFSHPADFTPVCTTELGATAKLKDAFELRNVKVLALSVDPVLSHVLWINDINQSQNTQVFFPIIADYDRKVSELFDFIHPKASSTATVRTVLIVAPDKTISLIIIYPASTGRNFNEIIRVIDSLQLTYNYQVATPANWQQGQEVVILPSVSDEELKDQFPKGHTMIKPYLRLTPQPNL
jgi:alkyl hydroperoxide reductase subunit AhpC